MTFANERSSRQQRHFYMHQLTRSYWRTVGPTEAAPRPRRRVTDASLRLAMKQS